MNRTQKIGTRALVALLLVGLALAAPAPVGAQQAPPGTVPTRKPKIDPTQIDQVAQRRAQQIGKQLGLTNAQVTQLAKLNSGALKQVQVLLNTRPSDKEAARLRLQQVLSQRQQALQKLLTPDQLQQYQAIVVKDGAAFISEIVARKLQLSEDQVKQLNIVNQQIIQKLQTIAQNNPDPTQAASAIDQVRAYKDREYQRVLTDAQWAQLKELKEYFTPTNADPKLTAANTKTNPYYGSPYDPTQQTMGSLDPSWGMYGGYDTGDGYGYGTYSSVWPSYYLW
jgi:hypothetical protein